MRSCGVAPTWYDAASVDDVTLIWLFLHGPMPELALPEGFGEALVEVDALSLGSGSADDDPVGSGVALDEPSPLKNTWRMPRTSASTTRMTRARRTQ